MSAQARRVPSAPRHAGVPSYTGSHLVRLYPLSTSSRPRHDWPRATPSGARQIPGMVEPRGWESCAECKSFETSVLQRPPAA